MPMNSARLLLLVTLAVNLLVYPVAQAVVLEGVGHATIYNGDLEAAREQARKAALRDVALQYEAQISSHDTMENGVVTESRVQVASSARARDARIVDEYRRGDLLRVTVRADMSEGASCGAGDAADLKKRVAVTGFRSSIRIRRGLVVSVMPAKSCRSGCRLPCARPGACRFSVPLRRVCSRICSTRPHNRVSITASPT